MDLTPAVLRNQGVPIEVARVRRVEDGEVVRYEIEPSTNGDSPRETFFLRFDCNLIADIEEAYDTIGDWQETMEKRPFTAVRKTLAMMLGLDERDIGARITTEDMPYISSAVGVAWAIANGVDPTEGSRALEVALTQLAEGKAKANSELAKAMSSADEPGAVEVVTT